MSDDNVNQFESDKEQIADVIPTLAVCPHCDILQQQVEALQEELEKKIVELSKMKASLSKTECQLKKATEISDKLLLNLNKLNAEKQITKTLIITNATEALSTSEPKSAAIPNLNDAYLNETIPTTTTTTTTTTGLLLKTDAMAETMDTSAPSSMSVADSIKAAAEEVCSQMGYVYDQRTGMYYDYSSGYYYDNEQSLFFDPNTCTYFYYDHDSLEYKFHSQLDTRLYKRNHDKNKGAGVYKKADKNRHYSNDKMEAFDAAKRRKRSPTVNHRGSSQNRRNNTRKKTGDHTGTPPNRRRNRAEQKINVRKTSRELSRKTETVMKRTINKKFNALHYDTFNTIEPQAVESVLEKVMETAAGQDLTDREEGELSDDDALSDISSATLATPSSLSGISRSESESNGIEESDEKSENSICNAADEWEDFCNQSWAPCIRCMVTSSDVINVGGLTVITSSGATMGREAGLGHVLVIPDLLISKMHIEFVYDETLKRYTVTDHASQNGTLVNGERLGVAKIRSEARVLQHCDVIKLGNTELTLHIHPGKETCDGCEPGQVQSQFQTAKREAAHASKEDRETARRKQLKHIKKRFGLVKDDYIDKPILLADGCTDKAAERRRVKGTDNPYQKDDQPASVHRAITAENKGHKLLQKLGWKDGQALGKSEEGIKEPISVVVRASAVSGLGSTFGNTSLDATDHDRGRLQRRLKTQMRFAALDLTTVNNLQTTIGTFISAGHQNEQVNE